MRRLIILEQDGSDDHLRHVIHHFLIGKLTTMQLENLFSTVETADVYTKNNVNRFVSLKYIRIDIAIEQGE